MLAAMTAIAMANRLEQLYLNASYNPIHSIGRHGLLLLRTLRCCTLKLDCDLLNNQQLTLAGTTVVPQWRHLRITGAYNVLRVLDGFGFGDRLHTLGLDFEGGQLLDAGLENMLGAIGAARNTLHGRGCPSTRRNRLPSTYASVWPALG